MVDLHSFSAQFLCFLFLFVPHLVNHHRNLSLYCPTEHLGTPQQNPLPKLNVIIRIRTRLTTRYVFLYTVLQRAVLRNGVLILNGKGNKEAGAICFEIRIPRKKNKKLLRKVSSKIYGSNFIIEDTKNIFWFVNKEMGLLFVLRYGFQEENQKIIT